MPGKVSPSRGQNVQLSHLSHANRHVAPFVRPETKGLITNCSVTSRINTAQELYIYYLLADPSRHPSAEDSEHKTHPHQHGQVIMECSSHGGAATPPAAAGMTRHRSQSEEKASWRSLGGLGHLTRADVFALSLTSQTSSQSTFAPASRFDWRKAWPRRTWKFL